MTIAAVFSFFSFLDSMLETSAWIKTGSASRESSSGCGCQSCPLAVDTDRNTANDTSHCHTVAPLMLITWDSLTPTPLLHNPVEFWHTAVWNVLNEWLEHLWVIHKLRNPSELILSSSMHGLPVVQIKFLVQTCILINIIQRHAKKMQKCILDFKKLYNV